jgi:hypothetical protein
LYDYIAALACPTTARALAASFPPAGRRSVITICPAMDAIVSDSAALTALIEATTKIAINAGLQINNFISLLHHSYNYTEYGYPLDAFEYCGTLAFMRNFFKVPNAGASLENVGSGGT